ncbi:hypothetical protein WJX72_004998 [[Myrmecia] bisecta]|uniref:F-box domain-containing protein n=1 Tax=[Myrmecia] bisecta TaxID=41462 RepID=A0AAW1PXJ9_9CHLO
MGGAAPAFPLLELPRPFLVAVLSSLELRHLVSTAHTCKEWKSLVDEVVEDHTVLDLNLAGGRATEQGLKWAMAPGRFRSITTLSLYGSLCDELLDQIHLAHPFRALSNLTVTAPSLHPIASIQTISSWRDLTKLDLGGCLKLGDTAAGMLAQRHPQLRELSCKDWRLLSDDGVQKILRHCTQLEGLTLDGCLRITHRAFDDSVCTSLKCVSLAQCIGLEMLGSLTLQTTLQKLLLRKCSKLRLGLEFAFMEHLDSVDLTGCTSISEAAIRALGMPKADGCTRPRSLMLENCSGVTCATFNVISAQCQQVEQLAVSGNNALKLTDVELLGLAGHCRCLRTLILSWCTEVTDAGLAAVLAANPNLRHLSVEGIGSWVVLGGPARQ